MDYKEIHQNVYEEMLEDLGREPTFEELEGAVRDHMSDLVAAWECA